MTFRPPVSMRISMISIPVATCLATLPRRWMPWQPPAMYVYTHMPTHTFVFAWAHACVCTCTCLSAYVYARICTSIDAGHMPKYIPMSMHLHTAAPFSYVHTHGHVHLHLPDTSMPCKCPCAQVDTHVDNCIQKDVYRCVNCSMGRHAGAPKYGHVYRHVYRRTYSHV